MGRPLIDIDPIEVEKLAQLGCRTNEIADYFDCSKDVIERRFAAQLAKGRSDLRMSLRRWQIQAAKGGNIAMMIWLGKQMLGQVDRAQLDITKIPDEVFMEEVQRRLKDASEQAKLVEPVPSKEGDSDEAEVLPPEPPVS
jgi:hypothetical protein